MPPRLFIPGEAGPNRLFDTVQLSSPPAEILAVPLARIPLYEVTKVFPETVILSLSLPPVVVGASPSILAIIPLEEVLLCPLIAMLLILMNLFPEPAIVELASQKLATAADAGELLRVNELP